jgi:hypothetical protein
MVRIMRITVAVDDQLLTAAKERARARGQTLGQVVGDALRLSLAQRDGASAAVEVPVFRGGSGPRPGIDLGSNRALHEVLDQTRDLDQLR